MILETEIPSWTVALFAAIFWAVQHALKRFVRVWALVTFPATVLHELAHAAVGWVLAAQPTSLSLWPKRVGATAWRLGSVGFQNLRWWNGGAVALAPLVWLLLIVFLARNSPSLPVDLTLRACLALAIASIWLWIAVAPSRSDWKLAFGYWPSATLFLTLWFFCFYSMVRAWL
jgi:hypothetical protein